MSWLRKKLTPVPHLLDPKATVEATRSFVRFMSTKQLREAIPAQANAIEHEQAVLEGFKLAYQDRLEQEDRNRKEEGGE